MKKPGPAIKHMATRKRLLFIAGAVVLAPLVLSIGFQYASDADEISRLRRHAPYGHHYIDAALTGGTVKWTSKEVMIWRVRKRFRECPSVDEFKAAFLNASPHQKAVIEVHHPALRLDLKEGWESHERADAILAFLAEKGYANAGAISN